MPRASSSRKRARPTNYREASSDEDQSEGETDSGVDEIIGKKKAEVKSTKNKGKGKEKQKEVEKERADEMDVDDADETASAGKPKSTPVSAAAPPKRPRGRPRKSQPTADENALLDDSASAKLPKRRGRPPKTKATISESEAESTTPRGRKSANASPVRSLVERPRTRSISRTRQESSASPKAGAQWRPGHKPKSKSRTKLVEVVTGDASDSGEADDEQPKKRRKVVP